ncbi:MAG: helix-turn-helix transcriptional regulator [Cumulibacter sp.]
MAVAAAIRDRHVLRFDYRPREAGEGIHPRPADERCRVEPHHLVTTDGRWYLLAWDLDRDDWRIFRVDRIAPSVPTGPSFTPREVPGGDANEYMAARFKGSNTNEWPRRGSVVLHLPASEVLPFAGDGRVQPIDASRTQLEAGAWSWEALAASFGRFEASMEAVEPAELRAAFATLAARYRTTAEPKRDRG